MDASCHSTHTGDFSASGLSSLLFDLPICKKDLLSCLVILKDQDVLDFIQQNYALLRPHASAQRKAIYQRGFDLVMARYSAKPSDALDEFLCAVHNLYVEFG